jgi:ferredoxin-NADP reductase
MMKLSLAAGEGRESPRFVPRSSPLRIAAIVREADAVLSFALESATGAGLPDWQPGAHVDVTLPSGRKRQYSLCGQLYDTHRYRIAVRCLHDGRGGSSELHALREGAVIEVSEPRNAFPFIVSDKYFFVAGGIGITAILPMVEAAAQRGADWTLVYAGRSRATMPFLAELQALTGSQPTRLHVFADDELGPPTPERWLELSPRAAATYVCGPMPLIAALQKLVPALHYERFSPAPVVAGSAFELVLARTGVTLSVAADETALDAVLRHAPHSAYSCQQGFCGTCKVACLEGAVEHRDNLLTPTQRSQSMLLCVSRAEQPGGRIVIDV